MSRSSNNLTLLKSCWYVMEEPYHLLFCKCLSDPRLVVSKPTYVVVNLIKQPKLFEHKNFENLLHLQFEMTFLKITDHVVKAPKLERNLLYSAKLWRVQLCSMTIQITSQRLKFGRRHSHMFT